MTAKKTVDEAVAPVQEIEYEIVTVGEKIRITIPENWKVTYGPVSPGSKGYGNDLALRIWETDTKQRAIFTNVSSFRALNFPVKRLFVRTKGEEKWTRDTNGNSKSKSEVNVEREWRLDEDE